MSFEENTKTYSLDYNWHLVGVLDYSKEKRLYLVEKVDQNNKLTDDQKKSKSPGAFICLVITKRQYCLIISLT